MAPKPRTKRSAKHVAKTVDKSKLAHRLADLADQQAMTPADVAKYPDLLKLAKLKPEHMTPAVIGQAGQINRDALAALVERYGANKKPAETYIPIEEPKAKQTRAPKEPKAETPKPTKPAKVLVYGAVPTAVLRWMGKTGGWTPEQALKALRAHGVELSPATVRIQLKAGANGERGEPAKITRTQAKELKAAGK